MQNKAKINKNKCPTKSCWVLRSGYSKHRSLRSGLNLTSLENVTAIVVIVTLKTFIQSLPVNLRFFVSAGHSVPHARGVQVSRRVRLLRGEDLLEGHATLPQGGQRHQREVWRRHWGGAAQDRHHQSPGASKLPVQTSHRWRSGLPGPESGFLRTWPTHTRDAGYCGPPV